MIADDMLELANELDRHPPVTALTFAKTIAKRCELAAEQRVLTSTPCEGAQVIREMFGLGS